MNSRSNGSIHSRKTLPFINGRLSRAVWSYWIMARRVAKDAIGLRGFAGAHFTKRVTQLPVLRDGQPSPSRRFHKRYREIKLISPSAQTGQFNLLRRSVQSQADSGLPTQRIPVPFRCVNHTFLYLYPRDR